MRRYTGIDARRTRKRQTPKTEKMDPPPSLSPSTLETQSRETVIRGEWSIVASGIYFLISFPSFNLTVLYDVNYSKEKRASRYERNENLKNIFLSDLQLCPDTEYVLYIMRGNFASIFPFLSSSLSSSIRNFSFKKGYSDNCCNEKRRERPVIASAMMEEVKFRLTELWRNRSSMECFRV